MAKQTAIRGERLKALRESLGYSQTGLAERLGLGQRQIHRYENGLTDPPTEILVRIAKELQVTTDYLCGISDVPQPTLSEGDLSPDEAALLAAYRLGNIREALQFLTFRPNESNKSEVRPSKPAANS